MEIKKVIVGGLGTNCYILSGEKEQVIVDPGAEPEKILNKIDRNKKLSYIFLTHGHFDHISAMPELKNIFNDAKILIHKNDIGLYNKINEQFSLFLNEDTNIKLPFPEVIINKELEIIIEDQVIKIIETPGHSEGSISFLMGNNLFSGDLIFENNIFGRTDLEGGNEEKMQLSIEKINSLSGPINIFPGHGEGFLIN